MNIPQKILGHIVSFLYKFYSSTFRYQLTMQGFTDIERDNVLASSQAGSQNFIFAFWHQDELSLLPYFQNKKIVVMVSMSKDGTIMDQALQDFGYITVRGSSSRGGLKAFFESKNMILKGFHFTMAVDGPRGPIYQAKDGAAKLSEKTKVPIICARSYPQNYYLFKKSWNKAKLPLPFSRINIVFEKPDFYSTEELNKKLLSL